MEEEPNNENITLEITEEEPVAEEPVAAEEPVVVEEPVAEEPVVDEPVVDEPVAVEEPIAEEPVVVEEPVVEEPVAEEPVVEEPVVEEPVVEEEPAAVEEPVAVEQPVALETVPKIIFIVPYRDRQQHLEFFKTQMTKVLEDMSPSDYKIWIIHQNDAREFNRGGMKNIGFLAIKNKYPNDYKNITIVFNDVDTMPYSKNFLNYETTPGVIKHFYGYTYTLGGIVSIKAGDFERINGFPNFWAWGYEDNLLQKRAASAGITIDRSQFYPIMHKDIMQLKDGLHRLVNRGEFDKFLSETNDGIFTIQNLQYSLDEATGFVTVNGFVTNTAPNPAQNSTFDLRAGNVPFRGSRRGSRMGMFM